MNYLLGKQRPTVKDIEDYVVIRVAPQWKQLGRQLKIDHHLLNIIQHDHGSDCVECCSRMLDEWLQNNTHDNTTWELLLNAIDTLYNDKTGITKCMGINFITIYKCCAENNILKPGMYWLQASMHLVS